MWSTGKYNGENLLTDSNVGFAFFDSPKRFRLKCRRDNGSFGRARGLCLAPFSEQLKITHEYPIYDQSRPRFYFYFTVSPSAQIINNCEWIFLRFWMIRIVISRFGFWEFKGNCLWQWVWFELYLIRRWWTKYILKNKKQKFLIHFQNFDTLN